MGAWDGGEGIGETVVRRVRRVRSLSPLREAIKRLDPGHPCAARL